MQAKVVTENGSSFLEINGERHAFVATRSFRPEGHILEQFSAHGLKFFQVFPSGIMTALEKRTVPYSVFGPVWVGEEEYNWENLRKQCNVVMGHISSDAYVAAVVHLDPPPWFVNAHPELVDHWEQMIQNVGSDIWRRAAAKYLCALIDKLDEWYPERIYGIFLLSGGTTEWYSYHIDKVIEQPTVLQRQSFCAFVGDERAEIPTPARLHAAADGVIRSRAENADAIRYWRFTNEIVTDTILYFARVAKEHTDGGRIVGLFSGHIYGQNLDYAVRSSYNCLDRLLKSPDIDMLFCPASYLYRKLNSTSGIRVPIDSIRAHGKLFCHEIDSATHLLKNNKEKAAHSHAGRDEAFICGEDTVAYLRREVGMVLAKGQGYWWFDMFSGYYDDPMLMKEIGTLREISEKTLRMDHTSVSEVCEMLDEESNYYLKTDVHYPMVEHQTEALNLTGAPWDACMTFDLDCPSFHAERYKLFIFPALFSPTAHTCEQIEMLRRRGKCMLYLHAPFYAALEELSLRSMEKHTGICFEKCALTDNTVRLCFAGAEHITYRFSNQTVAGDIWKHQEDDPIMPVFSPQDLDIVLGRFVENGKPACGIKFREDGGFDAFSACAPVPVELLREIYRYAGIFFYADRSLPVYTDTSFASVYCYSGGAVTLYRPEPSVLTDAFSGERITVDAMGRSVFFRPHETRFFYVEKGSDAFRHEREQ